MPPLPRLQLRDHRRPGAPWMGLLAALLLATGCDARQTDGGDLHGVFDRPSAHPRPGAAPSASAPRARASAPRSLPAPLVRTPPTGPCIAARGTPLVPEGRNARRPACRRARVLEWRDRQGAPRYGCVFAPANLSARAPLPLLIFFHDEYDSPTAVHRKTRLRRRLGRYDMTGVAAHGGFVVLAPQGRRLGGKLVFDSAYTAPDNVDAQTVDHFVDTLASEGSVDARQIYAVGAAGGGRMAVLYALLRPDRIAAVATFATAALPLRSSCSGPPLPAVIVYRACDTVVSCSDVEQWIDDRRRRGAATLALRLSAAGKPLPSCALGKARCRDKTGRANHARWPKGMERRVLDYLSRYTLAVPPATDGGAGAEGAK